MRIQGNIIFGSSVETKPIDVPDGFLFVETDTSIPYVKHNNSWQNMPAGGDDLNRCAKLPPLPTHPDKVYRKYQAYIDASDYLNPLKLQTPSYELEQKIPNNSVSQSVSAYSKRIIGNNSFSTDTITNIIPPYVPFTPYWTLHHVGASSGLAVFEDSNSVYRITAPSKKLTSVNMPTSPIAHSRASYHIDSEHGGVLEFWLKAQKSGTGGVQYRISVDNVLHVNNWDILHDFVKFTYNVSGGAHTITFEVESLPEGGGFTEGMYTEMAIYVSDIAIV